MRTKALIFGLLLAASTHAQLLYHDASAFPLLGKATDATLTRYERLPASFEICFPQTALGFRTQ